MSTPKKFTPKFLYRDGDFIKGQQKYNEDKIPFLNECLTAVSALFDKELTIAEKTEILQLGWKKVEEMHRSKSQFPKANIKTLLELHGIEAAMVDNAEKLLKEHSSKYLDSIFTVTKTGVELSVDYLKNLEEKGNYYTTSEAQNQKLESIEDLAKALNTAIDLKIIPKWRIEDIIKATGKIIGHGITKLDDNGFKPNYENISKLKDM